jgi:opacity protein-like surface antigen
MIRSARIRSAIIRSAWLSAPLFLFTSLALSQNQGHFDASINGGPVFTKQSDGNGVQQSATIGSNYFGTFRFRKKSGSRHSLIFNYGRAKNSQVYQTNFDYHILTKTTEYSGAYVYNFLNKGKFEAFALVGAGALGFYPTSTWLVLPDFVLNTPNRIQINLNAAKQTNLAYLYGGGVDYRLPWRFALRLQYRGLLYNAPDFKVNGVSGSAVSLSTGSKGHMAEPSVGLVFRF